MIYFIQCNGDDGPIKIGYTRNGSADRLRSMQSSNPYDLRILASIPGGRTKEAEIQRAFEHLLIRGEWFRYSPEIIEFIKEATDKIYIKSSKSRRSYTSCITLVQKVAAMPITQRELADRLGVTQRTVSAIFSGEREPGKKVLAGILREFPELRQDVMEYLEGEK